MRFDDPGRLRDHAPARRRVAADGCGHDHAEAEQMSSLCSQYGLLNTKALLHTNRFIYESAMREKSAHKRSDKCRGRPNLGEYWMKRISLPARRVGVYVGMAAVVAGLCAGCSSGPTIVPQQRGRPASAAPPPPSEGGPAHMKPNPNSPANVGKP